MPSFNPSGSTAVPGNTSRQRLATSPRPLPRFVPRKRPRRIDLDDLYRKKPKKLPKFDPNPKPEPEDKPKEQTEKARKAIDWIGNGTLIEVADALDRVRQVLKQEGVRDIIVTPQSFKAYQQRLRTRGFDAQERKAARLLGLTQAELESLRRKRLRMDPLRASVSLFKLGKQLSSALRTLGEHWVSLSPNCTM